MRVRPKTRSSRLKATLKNKQGKMAPAASTDTVRLKETSPEVTVMLPDFFQSFLKETPPVNPHYEAIRSISEEWLSVYVGVSST